MYLILCYLVRSDSSKFDMESSDSENATLGVQFLVLIYRSFLINVRDGANCWLLLIIGALVSAIAGAMFRNIKNIGDDGANEEDTLIFLRNAYFLGCFYVVDLPSFSLHRWFTDIEFFRHELNNGYYKLFPLFVAETLVTDMLKYFFIACVFSSLFYPIVPFNHTFTGWVYCLVIYYLGAQCFISIARLLTCSLVWDESYSHSAYGFVAVLIGLTCGVLVLPSDLPYAYVWMYFINPMAYMINGLTLHEFKGRLTGSRREDLEELWPQNPWENAIIVFFFYVFLRLVIYFCMFWIRRNRPSMLWHIKKAFSNMEDFFWTCVARMSGRFVVAGEPGVLSS